MYNNNISKCPRIAVVIFRVLLYCWMLSSARAFHLICRRDAAVGATSRSRLVLRAIGTTGSTNSNAQYAVDQHRSLSSSSRKDQRVLSINTHCTDHNPVFTKKRLFTELCSDPIILQALHSRNMEMATDIQCETFAKIRAGQDVVIGAETGSGKTLAYMLPLLNRYAHSTSTPASTLPTEADGIIADSPVAVSIPTPASDIPTDPLILAPDVALDAALVLPDKAYDNIKPHQRGIILAPSSDLCDQIVNMTTFLFDAYKQHNVSIKVSRSADDISRWTKRSEKLELIVVTPRSLADIIKLSDHKEVEHPFWELDFLVLDEADMLLEGSYLRDVEIIMEHLKLVRRNMITRGFLKPHERRVQFLLAAATIPTYGLRSIASSVKQIFPLASNVRSENMHQHHPSIRQDFMRMDDKIVGTVDHVKLVMERLWEVRNFPQSVEEIASDDVAEGMKGSPEWINSLDHSIMIFLNTAAKAKQFADSLYELGYDFVEIHGMVSREEREENLKLFRTRDSAGPRVNIMVCTDACARGLDLSHVRRVVQAEFALNVVQHLHRIGRASRGGAVGMAINLYGKPSEDLVHSIIGQHHDDDGTAGNSVEKSFSRRRGFRQKLKKAARESDSSAARTPLL